MADKRPPKAVVLPTPFGDVELPMPTLPPPGPPKIDQRRRDILKHTMGADLAFIPSQIPVVGDIVADVIEDLHGKEIVRSLTPDEMPEYMKHDKVAPSTIAAIRTFIKK